MTPEQARELSGKLRRRAAATNWTDARLLREAADAVAALSGTERRRSPTRAKAKS